VPDRVRNLCPPPGFQIGQQVEPTLVVRAVAHATKGGYATGVPTAAKRLWDQVGGVHTVGRAADDARPPGDGGALSVGRRQSWCSLERLGPPQRLSGAQRCAPAKRASLHRDSNLVPLSRGPKHPGDDLALHLFGRGADTGGFAAVRREPQRRRALGRGVTYPSRRRGTISPVSPARKPQLPDAGAVVAALERAWDVIRAHHPEVPPVVLVFGSCSARRAAKRKLGHFAPARWLPVHDGEPFEPQALPEAIDDGDLMAQLAASALRLLRSAELLSWEAAASLSEVLITADGLAGSATELIGTLVHEAAHAIAFQRGIKDTSRQGRYHNRRFKAIAEEIGLDVRRDPGLGWSVTTLSDPTAASYRDARSELAGALRAAGQHELQSASPAPSPRRVGIALVCECGQRQRVGRTVSAVRGAICGVCGGVMALPA
jgi:hypothetical protein